jgi:DnaJ domain
MVGVTIGDELSATFAAASLLALWAALPALLLAYVHQSLLVRTSRTDFALRRSEAMELNRAVDLYEDVGGRLDAIRSRIEKRSRIWRLFHSACSSDMSQDSDELVDLEAHAHLLRATIVRLKGLPRARLRCWLRLKSSMFALGGAISAHVLTLLLLFAVPYLLDQSALGDELTDHVGKAAVWYPFGGEPCYVNAVASAFAMIFAPLLYFVRMASLKQIHELSLCMYQDFANSDLSQRVEQTEFDDGSDSRRSFEGGGSEQPTPDEGWADVLGLKRSASLDEIRETYKTLIKQSHPDRVQGLSPALRTLAESETKRLNQAYQDALREHSFAE